MNRRAFLASIPLLPAAAKSVVAGFDPAVCGDLQWYYSQEPYDPAWLENQTITWLQATRIAALYSLEYEDLLAAIMISDPVERRIDWHQRRRVRFSESLARQLAMPAPRLP